MWKSACSIAIFTPLSLQAVLPGAWETFPAQASADAWGLFDYADNQTYAPNWFDDADPFMGASFAPNAEDPNLYDQGIWFFADDLVADGDFVGDFAANNIIGIEIDVFIAEPSRLDFCDIAFFSNDNDGGDYYYSGSYLGTDFDNDPQTWQFLNPLFTDTWYVFDSDLNDFVAAPITPEVLSNVTEIGIRFFPTLDNDMGWTPLVDNVALTPTPTAPQMETDKSSTNFALTIIPEAGNQYQIERFNFGNNQWEVVTGETGITGETPYLFETSLIPEGEFYRVLSQAYYMQVTTTAAAN